MAAVSVKELVEAGVHFGHQVSRWNPKMAPYIHGKRNLIHIINLVETLRGLSRARHFLKQLAASGRQVVFVGTKRQIKNVIMQEAQRSEMPYINERWLGGTLTNFSTIRSRLKKLEELEQLQESGELENYKKKEQSAILRQLRRIKKNLDGIRKLERVPGAVVVVDPLKEHIAIKEANRLRIPILAVLDTDCDPDDVDIPIPANDDAMRSVSLILSKLNDAVIEGKANFREGVVPLPQDDEPVIEMKKRDTRGAQRRPQRTPRKPREERQTPAERADAAEAAEAAAASGAPAAEAPAAETPAAETTEASPPPATEPAAVSETTEPAKPEQATPAPDATPS